MPDLFALLPPLKQVTHPLLHGRKITLVGVSAVLRDDESYYFEVNRPRYWVERPDGIHSVGVGGVGGGIERGEGALACVRREVKEELGVGFRLEMVERTALIQNWQFAGWVDLPRSKKHPTPYFVNLQPPRLGGPGQPDSVAIVTFLGRPRGRPKRGDLFGILEVSRTALGDYLEREEWELHEAQAHPGLKLDLEAELPEGSVLRPVLTTRALRVLVREGHHPPE